MLIVGVSILVSVLAVANHSEKTLRDIAKNNTIAVPVTRVKLSKKRK